MGSIGANENVDFGFTAARGMLVLEQFHRICSAALGICTVVPLKGVSLLKSIYSKHLDRDAGDIDLLVFPSEKAEEFVEKLTREGYRRQFDYLCDRKALNSKRKIALTSTNPLETDVDIHLDLVTKRYFRRTIREFNKDAISRIRYDAADDAGNPADPRLDKVDEWLFLAQHACFHQFQELKWIRDLKILADTFSPDEVTTLIERASLYNMRRVTAISYIQILRRVGHSTLPAISYPGIRRFEARAENILHRHHSKLRTRINNWFWEILCIDHPADRLRGYLRFIFPSTGSLKATYRTDSALKANLLRIPHTLVAPLAVLFFHLPSPR